MADFLRASFISNSSQGSKSDKLVSRFLGSKIFKKKRDENNQSLQEKNISQLQHRNLASLISDTSSQYIDQNEVLDNFQLIIPQEKDEDIKQQRSDYLDQFDIIQDQAVQEYNEPKEFSPPFTPSRNEIRATSISPLPSTPIIQKNGQLSRNGSQIPLMSVELRSKRDITPQPKRNNSKYQYKFGQYQNGEKLMILEFEIGTKKQIKLNVYKDDTGFSLTYKLLKILKIQITPMAIQNISNIITNQINNYIVEVQQIMNQQQEQKQLEKINKKINISQLPINYIGQLYIHLKGKQLGIIKIQHQDDPQECVRVFLREQKVEYNDQYFQKLVNEIKQIQNQYENQQQSIINKNKIILDKFQIGELEQLRINPNAYLIEATIKIHKKIIQVKAKRVCIQTIYFRLTIYRRLLIEWLFNINLMENKYKLQQNQQMINMNYLKHKVIDFVKLSAYPFGRQKPKKSPQDLMFKKGQETEKNFLEFVFTVFLLFQQQLFEGDVAKDVDKYIQSLKPGDSIDNIFKKLNEDLSTEGSQFSMLEKKFNQKMQQLQQNETQLSVLKKWELASKLLNEDDEK